MSHGLKVWDADGAVLLDTSTITARLIDVVDVAAGASGSVTDASYAGATVMCMSRDVDWSPILYMPSFPHAVALSGSTISYTAKDGATPSRILVFEKTS